MKSFPVRVGVTQSVLARWREWERARWEESGRPEHHPYPILSRLASVIRLESEEEALLVYRSALEYSRWWERDNVLPDTAAALRDCARTVVEEAGLATEVEVIERWIEEVRRLSDRLIQPALFWMLRSIGTRHPPSTVADLVAEQGITLEAEVSRDQAGANAFQRYEGIQDTRRWDVRLALTRQYQGSVFSSGEPSVEKVLTTKVRIARQVMLTGDFHTWWRGFWSDLPEAAARGLYEEARKETRHLRELLGEALFLEVIPRISVPGRELPEQRDE